ncbi:hypothetical protein J2Z32_000139 [Paenibacillus turicensis]|uniref:Transposase n=1 Tax=Paenibacillus turicensis TaxID=160487 RepID=A0ABS4FLS4_9BACL|nr:hypothetical protein [Paenibacillus turicensis]
MATRVSYPLEIKLKAVELRLAETFYLESLYKW